MQQSFIDTIAPIAIKHGRANNILCSVLVAQSILEGSWGKSELAANANNLFGIKQGSGWENRPTYTVRTHEYDKDGNVFYIDAPFRKYESYDECVQNLISKYVEGLPWEAPKNRYQAVIGEKDYKKFTQALKNASYATDPNYPTKLNDIIERYDLTKYDKEEINMVKVVIDAGHGINTPGKRSPSDEREWTFNNKVAVAAINRLNQYQNVQILRTDDPTGKTDVLLATRVKKANDWKADLFVSCHHNALKGVWHSGGGVETFTFPTASKTAKDVAKAIHARVVKTMGLRDRGLKTADFQVLRTTAMPSLLIEGGFMDSTVDIIPMRDDSKLRLQGEAIADGIAAYYGLKLKTIASTPSKPITPPPTPSNPQESVKSKEEILIMAILKGSSGTLNNAFLKYLEDAAKKGVILDKWAKSFKAGEMTMDDAFLLYVYIKEELNK